jgi:hypothetical protein
MLANPSRKPFNQSRFDAVYPIRVSTYWNIFDLPISILQHALSGLKGVFPMNWYIKFGALNKSYLVEGSYMHVYTLRY